MNLAKTVTLSLMSSSWYFVEFEDGATDFSLPQGWHNSINSYTAQALRARTHIPRMATSYNPGMPPRAHTFPQYAPHHAQPAQFGSFNPATLYGGGANPGPTPFVPNPYLTSAFTGMPQQPVYNITNVYNMQQQQQEQHHQSSLQKYNGMFTLLGGALKLAGAVLGPELSNSAGTGSGFSF